MLNAIALWSRLAGIGLSTEVRGLRLARNADGNERRQRPDALLHSRRLLFDVTIINCLSESGLLGNIGLEGNLTCRQEEAKRTDYADLAELNNLVVRGFGMDVFGRFGKDALEVISTLADVVGDSEDSAVPQSAN